MLVSVYKSTKKQDTYLYIAKRDDFSSVPKALMESFGPAKFVMVFAAQKRQKLGTVDLHKMVAELKEKGYYLQLPPPSENLLKTHLHNQRHKKESER